MRKPAFALLKIMIFLMGLIQMTAFFASCGPSTPAPTTPAPGPAAPTSTFTPVIVPNSNGPHIGVIVGKGTGTTCAGVTNIQGVEVFLADEFGIPITTAAITLFAPSGTVPVPYMSTTGGINIPPGTGLPSIVGGWYFAAAPYTPGQNYSVNIVIGVSSYAATITAIDGSPNISVGALNVVNTWTGGGNKNLIYIPGGPYPYGPALYGPPISSPYVIPVLGATNVDIQLWMLQDNFPAFNGAQPSSYMAAANILAGCF